MRKQRGYFDIKGLGFFLIAGVVAVILSIVAAPFIAYSQYQEYKEDQRLIKDCERNLPREQSCEIIKAAKVRQGGAE